MICYYRNSQGKEIDLMRYPYRLITGDFFSYEWEAVTYNNRIYGFQRSTFEKTVKLDVFCRGSEFPKAMNDLESVIAVDILNKVPGKLYVNGEYLSCYIRKVDKSEWEAGVYTVVNLTVISDRPYWINELTQHFYKKDSPLSEQNEYLDFPFDHPFDFTVSDVGAQTWYIDHIGSCPFTMTVYGPVTDPRILINERPYEIYTTLESNEHLILDSREHTITKYLSNGTTANLFNNRRMQQSVFDPIEPGTVYVNWPGTFGFDITAYIERNEPLWVQKQG